MYAFAVTLRSQLSRPWDCALAINRAARSACRSAASRRRPLLSPPTHVAVVLKLLMRGNRKIIGCCSSICPFSVNWKSFFQSIGRDLLNELQCRSGTLVSGWILVLLIKLLAPPLAFYVRGHGVFEWRPHKALRLWAVRFFVDPHWAALVEPQNIHRRTRAIFVCCDIGKNYAPNKCHRIIPQ